MLTVKRLNRTKVCLFSDCLEFVQFPITFAEIASFSNLPSVPYSGAHLKQNYSPHSSPIRIRTVEESLLHKKLCNFEFVTLNYHCLICSLCNFFHLGERNLSLWNSLNTFIQSTVASTSKRLIAADQLLVQSQVTLQTASKTIKKANETTVELTDKFKSIVNGNFIPPINLR